MRWKGVQWMSLSSSTVGQTHLMRCRRAPLALSGTARKHVPVVAASPCFDTRPSCRGLAAPRWLAAGLARWWSLHEDLHATTQVLDELAWELHVATQVPAQLVGLAAVWEWRWSLGRCGPGCGLVSVLGKGLAGAQGCKKNRICSQHKERLPRFGPRGCVKP